MGKWPLLVGLVFLIQAIPVWGQTSGFSIPLDDYWQRLGQTQALVASLLDGPPEVSHPSLLAAADQWETVTAVILPDGTQVPLDHSFLISQLRVDPPDLAHLNELLTVLIASRQNWSQARFSAQDVEALAAILARPEFQWPPQEPSLIEIWLQRLKDIINKFLSRLLPDTVVIDPNNPLFKYLLTGLVTLALVVILFLISKSLLVDLVAEGRLAEAEAGDETLTAGAALKRAQALSSVGDYRTAVRYLYLSSLLLLEERRLLRYDRSRTNHEYLRGLAHLPELAPILRDVIEVFDRVWYGYQPLDEAAYDRYETRIADLNRQAKQ